MSDAEPRIGLLDILKTTFARGLVVLIPVVITVWVLNILFSAVDGITSPIFDHLLERHIPGLGFLSMIVLILMVGLLSRNLIGRAIFRFFERILFSIPLARTIYSSMKDLISAFQTNGKGRSFKQVLLIEYPRAGLFTIGFATNELRVHRGTNESDMVTVYIPNPPNPTSGLMILVPRADVHVLDMSVEEGIKMVLSGGIVTSTTISVK